MHRRLEGRKKVRELQEELQEASAALQALTTDSGVLSSAEELAGFERDVKAAIDRVQSLSVAIRLQQTLMDDAFHEQERQLFEGSRKKWKNYGYRPVTIHTLGGLSVTVMARYFATHNNRARKGKGAFPGVLLLGVCEDCTPALASEVAQLAAALSSFDDARERLATMGIGLSVKKISQVAYHFSQRARRQQQLEGMGIEGTLAGRRVVISTDGGRLRVRRKKPGDKLQRLKTHIESLGIKLECDHIPGGALGISEGGTIIRGHAFQEGFERPLLSLHRRGGSKHRMGLHPSQGKRTSDARSWYGVPIGFPFHDS